jgi:hypothetical protein
MRYFILLLCISISYLANAQKKVHYTGGVEGGLLKGSNKANGFVFTTQGIGFKQFSLGAGSGIDYYGFRSIPLFIDVKMKFNEKAVQPFIQAASGFNFTSPESRNAKLLYQYTEGGHFENGFFIKGGGGVFFKAQKKLKISLSAGYSYKTSTYKYQDFNGTPWILQIVPVKDVYHFNRWYLGVDVVW